MTKPAETDLYPPVKNWLEAQGFTVKSEIGPIDVMATRGDDPLLIVELKLGFSLTLLQQAVARQTISEDVWVAVPRWSGKSGWRTFKGNVGLCRRLGLGVISVKLPEGKVQVHAEPAPFKPRKSPRRKTALMKEFDRREGDPNSGGQAGAKVTAYRQEALRCAAYLAAHGQARGADVAKGANVPRATTMMRDNHYGWFQRCERGVYALATPGQDALNNEGHR